MKTANAHFAIKSWDEKPFSEVAGQPKLTKASVVKALTGDLEGEGKVEYLMTYLADGSAAIVGVELVSGTLAGKHGSFVLQRIGRFENGTANETYTVVPGSGTGGLAGLKGEGRTSVGHGMEHPFSLSYEL